MTAKSARERYRILSHKLGWNAKPGGSEGEIASPKTPKKAAGVSKRTGRVGDSAKKGRGKKTAAMQNDADDMGKGDSDLDTAGDA